MKELDIAKTKSQKKINEIQQEMVGNIKKCENVNLKNEEVEHEMQSTKKKISE